MKKLIFVLLVALFSFGASTAQDNRISISPELNIPLGKLAWSYKPSMGIQLNYARIGDTDSKITKEVGFSVSYTSLAPLADTLYFVVDRGGVGGAGIGTAVYSSFKMIHFKGNFDFGVPIVKKKLALNFGFGVGYLQGIRDILFEDSFGSMDGVSENVAWATLVPKVGLEYKMSKNFSIATYLSYSIMIQMGSSDPGSLAYNEDTGKFYHYYTPGISLNYYF